MDRRIYASVLSVFLLAGLAAAPTGMAKEDPANLFSAEDITIVTGGGGGLTDGGNEARCGGLAPLEPCSDSLFLPTSITGLFLGADIGPEFNGYLVITLTTGPYFIEVTCEILAAGVVAAACAQTGGQGLLVGTEMTLDVTFDPVAVGQYEVFVYYE